MGCKKGTAVWLEFIDKLNLSTLPTQFSTRTVYENVRYFMFFSSWISYDAISDTLWPVFDMFRTRIKLLLD